MTSKGRFGRDPAKVLGSVCIAASMWLALPTTAHARSAQGGAAQGANGETIAHVGIPPSVPACIACHGAAGQGNAAAGFPRLAGLSANYLVEQLADFASGTRNNAVMSPIAKALPTDARVSLADYFASLPAAADQQPSSGPTQQLDNLGETVALEGDWKHNVPACVSCHGDQGSGIGANFPALAGQPAAYIRNQLAAWKSGTRAPGPLGLMDAIAHRLSDQEAGAAAAYFASLPPVSHPHNQGAAR